MHENVNAGLQRLAGAPRAPLTVASHAGARGRRPGVDGGLGAVGRSGHRLALITAKRRRGRPSRRGGPLRGLLRCSSSRRAGRRQGLRAVLLGGRIRVRPRSAPDSSGRGTGVHDQCDARVVPGRRLRVVVEEEVATRAGIQPGLAARGERQHRLGQQPLRATVGAANPVRSARGRIDQHVPPPVGDAGHGRRLSRRTSEMRYAPLLRHFGLIEFFLPLVRSRRAPLRPCAPLMHEDLREQLIPPDVERPSRPPLKTLQRARADSADSQAHVSSQATLPLQSTESAMFTIRPGKRKHFKSSTTIESLDCAGARGRPPRACVSSRSSCAPCAYRRHVRVQDQSRGLLQAAGLRGLCQGPLAAQLRHWCARGRRGAIVT